MEFDIEQKKAYAVQYPQSPKIVQFILKYSGGIIKTDKQAEYVLLTLSVIVLTMVVFAWMRILNPKPQKEFPIVYQEDLTPELLRTLPKEIIDAIPYKYEK